MKKITLFFIIVSAFTGCKKWLEVQPSDLIVDTELFTKATGFRNALNGVYIQAARQPLYGKNLSWGLPSSFSQEYALNRMGTEQQIAQEFDQNHANSKALIDNIWSTAYNNITNCNKLLKEIEGLGEDKFLDGRSERNLIIGEATAMRALMHFEILRLYAPSPAQDVSGKYIPYVSTYPAKLNPPVATSQVIEQIISDLEKAQGLVAESDTLTYRDGLGNGISTMLGGMGFNPTGGSFFTFRMHRLNYVAIHALLARVYLYTGNFAKAKQAAKYVYDNFGPHGRLNWWHFTAETNTSGSNRHNKMASDILFAAYDADLLANISNSFFGNYRISPDVDQWFPASDRDYRAGYVSDVQTDVVTQMGKVSEKWDESRSATPEVRGQNTIIPVIRLSEVYYIYSEMLFKDGQVNEALTVLNQVRNARGKLTTFSLTDEQSFYDELLAEYRREFLTEGQTFYAFKRLRRNLMRGTQVIPMDNRFTLPIPQQEQIF
ncbi:MAG: RagB/SusD family nutrient uptake outer membrane protein [Pseudobacter sp.]|uniref:RagB/SusD family nutrient uptake outer membrane protein n=1 Tax=Pseudobacter sp. TaxID=2045420 RepID=UPI003F81F9E7